MSDKKVVEEMSKRETEARVDGGTVATLPRGYVRMLKERNVSLAVGVKVGTCLRLPHTEALTYIKRDQAVRISQKEFDDEITKKLREAKEQL